MTGIIDLRHSKKQLINISPNKFNFKPEKARDILKNLLLLILVQLMNLEKEHQWLILRIDLLNII